MKTILGIDEQLMEHFSRHSPAQVKAFKAEHGLGVGNSIEAMLSAADRLWGPVVNEDGTPRQSATAGKAGSTVSAPAPGAGKRTFSQFADGPETDSEKAVNAEITARAKARRERREAERK